MKKKNNTKKYVHTLIPCVILTINIFYCKHTEHVWVIVKVYNITSHDKDKKKNKYLSSVYFKHTLLSFSLGAFMQLSSSQSAVKK